MVQTEYKCQCCGMELDETEFGDVRDADICGYCFTDRLNDIRRRGLDFCVDELAKAGVSVFTTPQEYWEQTPTVKMGGRWKKKTASAPRGGGVR